MKAKLLNYFSKKDPRSRVIFKNIIGLMGVKGGSIAIGLLLVPLTINYVNATQYGIWLTVSSIVNWLGFFDVGLGNGLRLKLTTALAKNDFSEAKKYVSTTYLALILISIFMFFLFVIIVPLIDWNAFLNISTLKNSELEQIILITLCVFCMLFVAQIINTILIATHKSSKAALISFIGQLFVLAAVLFLKQFFEARLILLVTTITIIPVITTIFYSIFLYNTSLKNISPSFKFVDINHIKGILNVGGVFFVIQIGAIILFQTDNIIVSKILGPVAVTEFNVIYKLFSIIIMIFTIIITPYWSAFTDAYVKNDLIWMDKSIKQMKKVWIILSLCTILLYLVSPFLLKIWIGNSFKYHSIFLFSMLLYVVSSMWQTIHVYLLNGVGKVRLQLYLVIFGGIINIPLAFYLGKKFGLAGVISANTFVFIVMSIFFTLQTNKILSCNAKGIWNK